MRKARIIRWTILCGILGIVMIIHALHTHFGTQYPSVHAFCPLGGLENLWVWLNGEANIQKLFSGTMTLFFMTIIFALIFGRAFCGNICPFGFFQELLGKIKKNKLVVPNKVDKVPRYLKYLILVLITIMAWNTVSLWISPYDPYVAFSHIWSGTELFEENLIGFIILIVVVIGSIFTDRFFCKYLCPAGALYGIISKIGLTKIKVDKCCMCGECTNACPMGIDVTEKKVIRSAECIHCSECINVCPSEKQEIQLTLMGKTLKPIIFIILTVVIFFGSLFILDKIGLYQITVPSVEEVQEQEDYIKIIDLRGSMTIEEGATYTGIDIKEFYKTMEIPSEVPKDTLLKNVSEVVPGYNFHAIKAKN